MQRTLFQRNDAHSFDLSHRYGFFAFIIKQVCQFRAISTHRAVCTSISNVQSTLPLDDRGIEKKNDCEVDAFEIFDGSMLPREAEPWPSVLGRQTSVFQPHQIIASTHLMGENSQRLGRFTSILSVIDRRFSILSIHSKCFSSFHPGSSESSRLRGVRSLATDLLPLSVICHSTYVLRQFHGVNSVTCRMTMEHRSDSVGGVFNT